MSSKVIERGSKGSTIPQLLLAIAAVLIETSLPDVTNQRKLETSFLNVAIYIDDIQY